MTLPAAIRDLEEWARDGDRAEPETVGLDRAKGWPVLYEQVGGRGPEREVWNQMLYELSIFWRFVLANGVPLPWHQDVDYRHPAFVKGSDGAVYVSRENSGPRLGNSADPVLGGSIWRRH